MSAQTQARVARRVTLLALVSLLGLGACAGPGQNASSAYEQPFVAHWQEHSTPLIFHGPARHGAGYTVWMVPSNLPRGSYRVISRNGNEGQLIEGYRFEVDDDVAIKEVFLFLPAGYGRLEALDEAYVTKK